MRTDFSKFSINSIDGNFAKLHDIHRVSSFLRSARQWIGFLSISKVLHEQTKTGVLRMRGSIYQMRRYFIRKRGKRLSKARLKSAEINCFYMYFQVYLRPRC